MWCNEHDQLELWFIQRHGSRCIQTCIVCRECILSEWIVNLKKKTKNDIDNGNIIITQCPWHKKKWRKTTIRDFWIVDIVLIVPWLNYYRLGLDKVNSCFQSGKCYSIPLLWPILLPWISCNPSNHMPNKVLIKTRYPFTNFNGPTLPKLVLLCKCFEFILR